MVSFKQIQASNARIATSLPAGLVAVFVGATSGIGETSLRQFAKHARRPRAYFIGRSQKSGDRITAECKALNAEGEFTFTKADVGLIRVVDDVCREIKSKEKEINLLFLSAGTMIPDIETSEDLHLAASLVIHSRNRFIVNLLPLLEASSSLRRVVSVFTACKEGPIDTANFQGRKLPLMAQRGHASSIVTLSLEAIAKKAPTVSFIHGFPGHVKTNITRGTGGMMMLIFKVIYSIVGPFLIMPIEECGERHVFLATSAKYPAGTSGSDETAGVSLEGDVSIARGTDGKPGSGVYSIDEDGESAGLKVEELLVNLRKEGMVEQVWSHVEGEFKRITGVENI